MIVLRVLSYNGAPADGPSAQFDELGGTIGRADNNQLVLPDPERTISRVHARVVFRAGAYAVVDNGSNPISVNGAAVGAGREQPLNIGDELQIGGYLLAAEAAGAPKSDDPFADLFGDAPMGLAAPAAPKPPAPRAPQAPVRTAMAGTTAWPAPARTAAPAPSYAPSTAPAWPSPPPPAPARAPMAAGPAVIPDDWDPFAPDPVSAPPAADAVPVDAFASLPSGGGDSLDDLFGLGPASSRGDPLGDPLGGAPQQALMAQPNTAQGGDALASLARTATLMPASRSDHASELNTPMILPPAQAPVAAPGPAPLPQGAVFSWNDPPRDGRVVTLPGQPRQAVPRAASPAPAPRTAYAPRPAAPAPVAPVAPRATMTGATAEGEAVLLQALLQGLNTPGLRIEALTPETMQLLGQLLRESTRGAVELLVARAALKREMRAEMTMIVARENNPLKFSPTVEVALQHLLGPPSPGFMPPATAVRDAFDDLRAHQLGVMAGMRAALEGVLQRFDPKQLEGKLSKRSAIDSIIPATRKARLWEAFNELFAQLQTEAQDDFDEIFGKAFLKAYEDQLDRLHNEAGPR
jgi:FHA domain-containing protein